jgi:hypothetical protein
MSFLTWLEDNSSDRDGATEPPSPIDVKATGFELTSAAGQSRVDHM